MMKSAAAVAALIAAFLSFAGCTESGKFEPTVREKKSLEALIAATEPAIVRIDVSTWEGGGMGSGFVIDDAGIVVTNYHVIDDATSTKVVFADGTSVRVIGILGTDKRRDIVILKIQKPEKKLTSLKLQKARPQKGQTVIAFGAPGGLSFSVSEGIVSAVRSAAEIADFGERHDGEWIQTTCPISPGSSGGPLVAMSGEVVGISTFNIIKGQNLNFAVSASDIERIYENAKTANPFYAEPEHETEARRVAQEEKHRRRAEKKRQEEEKREEEKNRFEIVDIEKYIKGDSPPRYKVKLLSSDAKALSLNALSDIALKVSGYTQRDQVRFWIPICRTAGSPGGDCRGC